MEMKEPTVEQKSMLHLCYNAVVEKKAEDVLVLDLRGLTSIADFFLICHGSSERQVLAISDNVEKLARESGHRYYQVEGREKGNWVLMDFHDLVIHIFHRPARTFYGLDKLWSDARELDNSAIVSWE